MYAVGHQLLSARGRWTAAVLACGPGAVLSHARPPLPIPCTTVARTLLDLAAVLDRRALERAYDQAELLGVLDRKAVEDLLARSSCRHGLAALRAVVQAERPPALTRSELEKRFLAICSAAARPCPQVNAWVPLNGGGIEVDFL